MAPTAEEIDRLLNEAEAAGLIGVQKQTMAKWRMSGNPDAPPFCKIGRSCRYKLSTLKKWIASRKDISSTQQAA